MKFRVEHTFEGIDLPAYEQLYFDEEFNAALCAATSLDRTLVSRKLEGNTLRRVSRIVPHRAVPAPIAKVLGGAQLSYVEHVEYELESYVAHWHIEPSFLADKIETYGVYRFCEARGGVTRVVDGIINVAIFGLGGLIERFVVADIEKSYEVAAEFTRRWLKS